ncbi:helix-turn-helix domain containing protein [Modestobacter sp. VKM Ac-2979]|uniref:helix-turn-helix domain containing protein n=1 Tax=unclassified Modestobacter TaxID=2643866 RepID=UPI0022ABBEE9|nr:MULTISPECIES: helix-turn-helix domain containing protein [unclassified Modestobacter]MCZ2812017.1 helix-turn-helix domain containing protein [Modestobacter sp. VKM Ac-2979]MCZ2843741.1 helix-turn-helix domain containing protein [Modestobacter sp. VKM Ac-2980]
MRTTRTCSKCGYTTDYASAPLADAHHPRHSCAKHRLALERAARRADRARTRTTRECSHAEHRHIHGTRAAYVKDRCRCTACTAANTAASRAANRERAYGRRQALTDAGPVHDHLVALRAAGVGVERIAGLAGMSVSHIRTLAAYDHGHSPATQRIRASTAARILSIDIADDHRAPHSRVDATGTRRRLQALAAIGWSPELLAAELDRRTSSLRRSMTSPSVTARTARDVAALYERLSNTAPPRDTSKQCAAVDASRSHATARRWLPPMAWDDIDTDAPPRMAPAQLPTDDVDEIAVERAMAGDGVHYADLTAAEQDQVVHRLTEHGRSIRDIAAQLATTKRTVSRHRAPLRSR